MRFSQLKKLVVVGVAGLAITGCSTKTSPVVNTNNFQTTDFSKEFQKGKACANYLLGFIGPFGDASLVEAAKNGNISNVEVVDYRWSYYVLLGQDCVIAYGDNSKS
ncbi:TRL domain-containing protein [Thiohalorhabdus sp. Cl-TMA]|uniref:TRL domain-containing protein n=1 Tax=Thiohalorhabdus methylotrophus TaxID=3242694 RepID=A0ABV4TWJ0_9GAMM